MTSSAWTSSRSSGCRSRRRRRLRPGGTEDHGFIANFKTLYNGNNKRGTIRVFLKYSPTKEAVIRGIQRVSKPGLRVYSGYDDIPRARGGFSVSILSTSQGVMTDAQAKSKK